MAAGFEMVELTRKADEPSAALLVERLMGAGIPAAVTGSYLRGLGLFFYFNALPAVMVRKMDLERARAIMNEDPPPEGWEDEAERMPREDAP